MDRELTDTAPPSMQSGEMIPLLKRHQVQVLLGAGLPVAEVARRTGVSERSVARIATQAPVTHVDDRAYARAQRVGRPSKLAEFHPDIDQMLKDESDILTLEVLRRLRIKGYAGAKTPVYDRVAAVRPRSSKPLVRFEGLAGEFCQHDFGQVLVRFVDGPVRRVRFFASRLKFSRWVQVSLVDDERAETLVRGLVEHYTAMGGVPLRAVFDRPSTVVARADRGDGQPEFNPVLAEVALTLGVGVELCSPRSGNQKGSVENLVGWVKGSFFKCRRFVDEADLREQLADWHLEANTRRPCRATGQIPAARMEQERPRLRALTLTPDTLALREAVVVDPEAMVRFEAAQYSMPPETIGRSGTIFVYRERVRVVVGEHSAEHPRLREVGARSVLVEHRRAMADAVHGKRAKLYYRREALRRLGPSAERCLTEMVHRTEAWSAVVEALFDGLDTHGATAVLCVMADLHARATYDVDVVREAFAASSRTLRGVTEDERGSTRSSAGTPRRGASGARARDGECRDVRACRRSEP